MKRMEALSGLILMLSSGLLIYFAPGVLSAVMTIIMCITVFVGYIYGLYRILEYGNSLKIGRYNISKSRKVQTEKTWYAVMQMDSFFANHMLDSVFRRYIEKITLQEAKGKKIYSDIEDEINADVLENAAFDGIMSQIPNTLTGIGILGTFIGLLIGIGNLGFTSIAAAMGNLQVLLDGINVAFYTSIAGVILSILFNLFYKTAWNMADRELYLFYKDFHNYVIPSTEEQEKAVNQEYYSEILMQLKKLGQVTEKDSVQKTECVSDEKRQEII